MSLLILGWGVLGYVLSLTGAAILSTIVFVAVGFKYRVTRLKVYFCFSDIQLLLRFGIFVSGRQALSYMAKRLDEVAIGYFLEPDVLGVYYFGKSMLERLRQLLSKSYSKVLLPLFSRIKDDIQYLSYLYLTITRYMAIIAFPVFIGIALTAHLFVPVIFGEQWVGSVVVFQVFSIALIFKMLTFGLAANALYAVNRPDTLLYLDIITDLIYFAGLLIIASHGINAVLVLYSSYILIRAVAMQYVAQKYLAYQLGEYISNIKSVMLVSLIMVLVVLVFQNIVSTYFNDLLLLIGSITVGMMTYILLSWLLDQKTIKDIMSMFIK